MVVWTVVDVAGNSAYGVEMENVAKHIHQLDVCQTHKPSIIPVGTSSLSMHVLEYHSSCTSEDIFLEMATMTVAVLREV